jgi:hypothetical protein
MVPLGVNQSKSKMNLRWTRESGFIGQFYNLYFQKILCNKHSSSRELIKISSSFKKGFIKTSSIRIEEREINARSKNEDLLDNNRFCIFEMFYGVS